MSVKQSGFHDARAVGVGYITADASQILTRGIDLPPASQKYLHSTQLHYATLHVFVAQPR